MATRRICDQRSDKLLVEICNDGDAKEATQAFEVLYKRHKDYVVRVALRFVHDHDLALDALQETFSYLLRQFPPTGEGLRLTAKLSTYIYPIAKNYAITLRRKADRFPESPTGPDDLAAEPIAAVTDIGGLLTELSDQHREVIALRFADDLSLQEIAEALQIPVGTAKSRLHLAIKQLKNSPKTKEMLDR